MPTLLQINTTLNSGSTGRIVEQISLLAKSKGWDCYIAHGARYVNKSQIKSIQIGTKFENLIHAGLGEFLGLHGFGSTLATYLFIHKIKKLKPDVIHLHNIHGYYLNIKVLFDYLAKRNIPVVWTLHDCWAFTGHCTHFELKGCEKWKTECGDCSLLMAQYKSRFFDRTRKNYLIKKGLYAKQNNLTIIPVSGWLSNLVSQSILKQHTIKVIYNGIDLNSFKPTPSDVKVRLGISDDKKMILGVVASGFGMEKGKREFIEYSKNSKYQIVIIGLADKDKRDLPSNIICINRIHSQAELAEYYTVADVFLNPTYNDTLPTTNLEALACGTPVITYRTGGSPETLDANTGVVVPQGNIEAMAKAIEFVISNGKKYYAKACRERIEKLYNKDERFEDYIILYNELLQH